MSIFSNSILIYFTLPLFPQEITKSCPCYINIVSFFPLPLPFIPPSALLHVTYEEILPSFKIHAIKKEEDYSFSGIFQRAT